MFSIVLGILDIFNKTLPAGFKLRAALQKPSGEVEVLPSLDATESDTDKRIGEWQELIDAAK